MLAVLVPALAVGATALGIVLFPGLTRLVGPFWLIVPLIAVAWSIKYLAFAHMRATDQAVDELRAKRFKVCIGCRYDLSALDDVGNCPECGAPYTREKLEADWRKAYPYYL